MCILRNDKWSRSHVRLYRGVKHRRPCRAKDCVAEGVFKPRKGVRELELKKIKEKYGRGEEKCRE